MPSLRLTLILSSLLGLPSFHTAALAFDPISALSVANTLVSSIDSIGKGVDKAEELGASFSALSELTSEVDPDASPDEDARRLNEQMDKITSLALEAGYTKEEASDMLSPERRHVKGFTESVRYATRAVRLGKRVVQLAARSTKTAAELANIETAKNGEQTINYQAAAYNRDIQNELKELLRRLQNEKDWKLVMEEDRKYRTAKQGGIYPKHADAFPVKNDTVEIALDIAEVVRGTLMGIILIIFFLRITMYQFSAAAPDKYVQLFGDTVKCMILLAAFPELVRMMYSITGDVAIAVSSHFKYSSPLDTALPKFPGIKWTTLPALLDWLIEVIRSGAFHICNFIFTLGVGLLVALFPIVIIGSTMFHFSMGLNAFFALLAIMISWPIYWNIIGVLVSHLFPDLHAKIASVLGSIIIGIVQLAGPFVTTQVIRGGSPISAMASGLSTAWSGMSAPVRMPSNAINAGRGLAADAKNIKSAAANTGRAVGKGAKVAFNGASWMHQRSFGKLTSPLAERTAPTVGRILDTYGQAGRNTR